MNNKSRLTSLLLTIFFGPFGVMYSSMGASIALIIVSLLTLPTIVIPLAVWLVSIAIGDHCTHKHNTGIQNLTSIMKGKA